MSSVETYGFEALEATFKNFAYKDKRSIMLSAFRKAAKPMAEQSKANAPIGKSGNLKRSMGVAVMRDEIGISIGARITGGFRGYHGHLVENGTVNRFYTTKKNNQHATGKMNPAGKYAGFFRKAFDATQEKFLDTVADEWYKSIDRFIVKSNKIDK
jgi:hypothetical protein